MTHQEMAVCLARAQKGGLLGVGMSVSQALSIIGTIQLASRHPSAGLSPSIQEAFRFARHLQDRVADRSPELGKFLERGWHRVFDVKKNT